MDGSNLKCLVTGIHCWGESNSSYVVRQNNVGADPMTLRYEYS
jgi:hypothetical protein